MGRSYASESLQPMAATGSSVRREPTWHLQCHDPEAFGPDCFGTRRSTVAVRRSRRVAMVSESFSRIPRLFTNRPSAPSSSHPCSSASSPKLVRTITARSRVGSLSRRRLSTVIAGRSGRVLRRRRPGRVVSARVKAVCPSDTTSTAHLSASSAARYISASAGSGSASRILCATRARAGRLLRPGGVLRSNLRRRSSSIAQFRGR